MPNPGLAMENSSAAIPAGTAPVTANPANFNVDNVRVVKIHGERSGRKGCQWGRQGQGAAAARQGGGMG